MFHNYTCVVVHLDLYGDLGWAIMLLVVVFFSI